MKLAHRTAIITGANQGFGFAVAEHFVQAGASLLICARDAAKLDGAASHLRRLICQENQQVLAMPTDVSVEDDVQRLITCGLDTFQQIDILVNNAGVYGPFGPIETVHSADWLKAIEINLFSIFLTCKYIIPYMKQAQYGKIINLSGGGATAPLPRISAYAASKAGVVRLTETLAEECRADHIDINAVAPGALNTRFLDDILAAGQEVVGQNFYEKSLKQKESGGAPLERGAALCVYLASAESDGITGKLISAIWDPWEHLDEYQTTLQDTDIYTLRRIVPADRGRSWGKQ